MVIFLIVTGNAVHISTFNAEGFPCGGLETEISYKSFTPEKTAVIIAVPIKQQHFFRKFP